ncbi:glycosyltransferase [Pedobacter sp. SYSU D00535]|uniref:glycosyltransferase n=1 Tax=Pedobacter sp. SYSU D00535 TaxID=2810308 RepID=UPI001A96EBEA|nr:glycosyltransferase [Pedobacter sp. SYSU D00535]
MFDSLITGLWIAIQVIIGYNLILPLVLFIWNLLKGKDRDQVIKSVGEENDYGIIVTAYEQTDSLPAVVESLLKLKYENFLIYIVADKCDISRLSFASEKVILLRPEETLASNTRSHFYAIRNFRRAHNRITIIDSDNLVHPDYLNELNVFFDQGYNAVQGVRAAKNLNTTLACLDAARDVYYHFYDGKILYNLGSSATLAGSGMAFSTSLYRSCLEGRDVSGAGFDKVLQYEILKQEARIAFAEQAIVYDEKTAKSDQLVNQRSRWINTWFKYFKFGFNLIAEGIKNFSTNQTLFGLILLRPPLFIFLILSAFFGAINLFIDPFISLVWVAAFFAFVLGFALALMSSNTDKRIYRSLINIPRFMFFQVLSLLSARKANQRSVATRHSSQTKIEEIIDLQEQPLK